MTGEGDMDLTDEPMSESEISAAIKAERLNLCDYLDTLSEQNWNTPSLCPGWTVRDVVAHLTLPTRTSMITMAAAMLRARGDFHRMTERTARRHAARYSSARLVHRLRQTAGSTRRMPGSASLDPLVDILVHGQDIARPLAARRPIGGRPAVTALTFVADSEFYRAPARLSGVRLVADDLDWTHGSGPEARGTAADLLLVATGRRAVLAGLSGQGTTVLSERMLEESRTGPVGQAEEEAGRGR